MDTKRIKEIDGMLANQPKTWIADKLKAERAELIAPPVAAGSVDIVQRYELVETQHGTGYMVHWDKAMEEDADGEWVKHADAIAWGAQQREAGRMEAWCEGANADGLREENAGLRQRAEKAKAELAEAQRQVAMYSICMNTAGVDALYSRANAAEAALSKALAQLVVDEQAAFEAWIVASFNKCGEDEPNMTLDENGRYTNDMRVLSSWQVWQARAALIGPATSSSNGAATI